MKIVLFSLTALVLGLLSTVVLCHGGANAMGAVPTENYTIPDPSNDPTNGEIKLQAGFILTGQSTRASGSEPSFSTGFVGTSFQNKITVVGNNQWYLDVDINMPGLLYVYEYYPPPTTGHWLAYKWQLKQGGVWRLGPFSAKENEPEGQHVYRLWFYGDGRWATPDAGDSLKYWLYYPEIRILSFDASPRDARQGDNVTLSWKVQGANSVEITMVEGPIGASGAWTVKPQKTTDFILIATGPDGKPVRSDPITVNVAVTAPAPQTPAAAATPQPSTSGSPFDQLLSPVALLTILAVIVIIVLGIVLFRVYVKRWASPGTLPLPDSVKSDHAPAGDAPPDLQQPEAVRAKLEIPNGLEIMLTGSGKTVGRGELARALGLDELCLISHKQFLLTYEDGRYFIEEGGSVNGTRLNGDDIRDKGRLALSDGDIIDVAGAIKLKFSVID